MMIANWIQNLQKTCRTLLPKSSASVGISLAETLVSIAVTGVIASLAATTVVKNNSEDWGKQTQLMTNRIAAAANSAQLKYGKPYLTATDTNGNLIYPNGMVSLLGSLDKAVKTTTSGGVTTFYYAGGLTISVGNTLAAVNNNDTFAVPSGTTAKQWMKIGFTNQDPAADTTLSVSNGNAAYMMVSNSGQGLQTWYQVSPSTAPKSFYDTFIQQNQPKLTAEEAEVVSPVTPVA
ncbi:MAG: hypothetical protein K2X01_01170 [Cyanobacteria bacterium]|nr:hypothetical protein [Cyanobacteriota bacterium]